MTKLDDGLVTSLPASDPGSAAVWGSKRINPRPQFCLCLTWSGCPSNNNGDDNNDDDNDDDDNDDDDNNDQICILNKLYGFFIVTKPIRKHKVNKNIFHLLQMWLSTKQLLQEKFH